MTEEPLPGGGASRSVAGRSDASETAARRAFARVASHALGGAVHSITSALSLLEQEEEGETLSKRQRILLQAARVEALRLMQLSDDLRILTHAEGGTLQVQLKLMPITTLVREAIEQAQEPFAPDRPRQVTSRVARTLPPALVDPPLARRALAALVENALRFSDGDTAVLVEARKRGDWAVIRVVDVGVGISAEAMARIFEPLYTGRDAENHVGAGLGVGLGLAVARACAEAQGGRVWLDRDAASGSVFVLQLPLAPTEEPS